MARTTPEKFIAELEGCLKDGTPTLNPLDIKKILEPKVTQVSVNCEK
jgi:hypothetical protein